jgi:hypothetical protein
MADSAFYRSDGAVDRVFVIPDHGFVIPDA